MAQPEQVGEYRIVRRLGLGGMGVVFEAVRGDDGPVALKLMNITDAEGLQRFQREFRALKRLEHENVVRVYDIGEHEGRPFFTMELVEGVPLDVWVGAAAGGAEIDTEVARVDSMEWSLVHDEPDDLNPWDEVVEPEEIVPLAPEEQTLLNEPERVARVVSALRQLLEALAHVHDNRIVHRDLKPANVMVSGDGQLHLMDFGIAVDHTEGGGSLDTGQLIGTFAYMSPEQLRGGEVDLRTDLYALGVMLFELLCDRKPFEADSPAAAIYQHVFKPPPKVGELNPGAPAELGSLVARLLRKRRGARPPSAYDVLFRLGTETEPPKSVQIFRPDLVGRADELKLLVNEMEEAAERKFRRACMLIGPAGVGKTRLIDEVCDRARGKGYRVLRLTAANELDEPYAYLAPLLELVVSIAQDQPLLGRRLLRDDGPVIARIAPKISEVEALEITAAAALNTDDERRRSRDAIWRVLNRLSHQEPLLLVTDQLEMADALSLDALQNCSLNLELGSRGALAGARPGSLTFIGAWREGVRGKLLSQKTGARRIVLNPLGLREVRELAGSCLGYAVDSPLGEALTKGSEGMPLVVIEVLRILSDRGGLQRPGIGPWGLAPGFTVDAVLESSDLSTGLAGLVEGLLAGLDDAAKSVLRAASLHRSSFRLGTLTDVLEAMGTGLDEESLLDAQDHLIRHGILVENPRHRGIYRVAYQELSRVVRSGLEDEPRRAGHRFLADWHNRQEVVDDGAVAYHAAQGQHDALALKILPDQARRARALGDPATAMSLYEQLAAVHERTGEPYSAALVLGWSEMLRDQGIGDGGEAMLLEALDRDDLSLDDRVRLELSRTSLLGNRGEGEAVLERLKWIAAQMEAISPETAFRAQAARASALNRFGDAKEALEAALDSLRRRDEMGLEVGRAQSLQLVALGYERTGDMREALVYYKKATDEIRKDQDVPYLLVCLVNTGSALIRTGDFDAAEDCLIEAEELADRVNHARHGVVAKANREWLALERGASEALDARFRRLLGGLAESGNGFAEPELRMHRARCLLGLGLRDDALEQANISRELAERSHLEREAVLASAIEGYLTGDIDRFAGLSERCVELAAIDEGLFVAEMHGAARKEAGDLDAALRIWEAAVEKAVEHGYGTAQRRLENRIGKGASR